MAVTSKKNWSVQTVFKMARIDIRDALAEVARDKRFVESLQWRSEETFFAQRTWWLVLSMEGIPSKLKQDWWNETLTRGTNLKNLSLLYNLLFRGDLKSVVYVSLLPQKMFPSACVLKFRLCLVRHVCSKKGATWHSKSKGHFTCKLWSLLSVQL